MPLSEFLRMAGRRFENGQHKPCPLDPSSRTDNELVELVWENGKIMMQGQSSRITKTPALNSLPSNAHKVRDPRIGKFGQVESILNDMSPSDDLDLSQNDEMVPWLDALTQDYGSVLLPEISGVTANGMSTQNNFVSVDKRANCEQTGGNLHGGGNNLKGSSSKTHLLGSWPPQHRQTSDALGSGVSDVISNNTSNVVFGNPAQSRERVNDSTSMKPTTNNTNNSNYLNFSHFARPVNLVRANVASERMEVKEKGSAASGSNAVKSTLVDRVTPAKDSCPTERTEKLCQENSIKNDKPLVKTKDSAKGVPNGERTAEPMVVSSSVGSGNSADRVSCEQTLNSKRKFRDTEDSECRSDDIETESVGVKKPSHGRGSGSKRTRAAEVHNLSERRRRDRINEKMRALQELIPNCNKVDKASMLDEAIEYLKTLQLQVQMMSMGAGLCMPPMMYPTGMQHMHPAHIPQYSPMGVGMGMGMGMGFGLGMLDMNGGSPVFPVSPLQAPHFPSSMPANFQRMAGPSFPVYGQPMVPLAGQQLPVSSAMGLSTVTNGNHNAVPCTSPVLNSVDILANSQLKCNAEASSSINQKPNQMQATNEVLNHSSTMQENKRATDANGPAVLTSTTATDISKEPGFD